MPDPASPPKSPRPLPRVSTVTHFLPDGCRFHVGSTTEAYRVEKFGGEEEFTRLILAALRPDDVFFDIGSSIGFTAVHAARVCRHVYAFEPDADFCERLAENARLNDLTNLTPVSWAVSDAVGTVALFTDGIAGNSPTLAAIGAPRPSVTVQTRSIDDALAAKELMAPQVCKLDVEGAEVRAIRGMHGLLTSAAPPRALFVEIHPPMLRAFGDDWDQAETLLRSAGYAVTYQQERSEQIHRVYQRD